MMTAFGMSVALIAAMTAGPVDNTPIVGTFPVDPVELVRGNEVPGREDISADHYIYRYLFATKANQAEFLAHPDRYEIQLGGGCGRMGPLSGLGDPKRFAVHEGRIYIFASDGCRKGFLSAPEKMITPTDSPPAGDAEAHRRGRELIGRAVEAAGGPKVIDAVTSHQERRAKSVDSEGETVESVDLWRIDFPDRIRIDQTWGEKVWTKKVAGNDGWIISPDEKRPMHAQQRAAMRRDYLAHNIIGILQARGRSDFIAVDHGRAQLRHMPPGIDATDVRRVAIATNAGTCTLVIEAKTGVICGQEYIGRSTNLTYGQVEKVFTEQRTIDGVTLPAAPKIWFDGEPVDTSARIEPQVGLNTPMDS